MWGIRIAFPFCQLVATNVSVWVHFFLIFKILFLFSKQGWPIHGGHEQFLNFRLTSIHKRDELCVLAWLCAWWATAGLALGSGPVLTGGSSHEPHWAHLAYLWQSVLDSLGWNGQKLTLGCTHVGCTHPPYGWLWHLSSPEVTRVGSTK